MPRSRQVRENEAKFEAILNDAKEKLKSLADERARLVQEISNSNRPNAENEGKPIPSPSHFHLLDITASLGSLARHRCAWRAFTECDTHDLVKREHRPTRCSAIAGFPNVMVR